MRLDLYLTENGLTETRTRAKNLIELGKVAVNGKTATKCAYEVKQTDNVVLTDNYDASLGGIKLRGALKEFSIDVSEKRCLDVGASNGGFCDVLLSYGAKQIIALDVGECALPQKLATNEKIIVMDRTNAKSITPNDLPYLPDLITVDVSFISLTQVLPALYSCLTSSGIAVCLIKPQFECGKSALSKKGIVIDKKQEQIAIKKVEECAVSLGFFVRGVCSAPHPFEKKNQEYFIFLSKEFA